MWARAVTVVLSAGLAASCLAPPPPIVVDTPFGEVRARTADKAGEIAELLQRLAPEVKALLPGSQDRPVDVWVQEQLAVYLFGERPESVRGFTLLQDEFQAKRIHLQEGGQSPWYLAHELVHALIGPSWSPLPGILEEGLGDVVAERLNPEYEEHIRSHRLLNAGAFTGGLEIEVVYREPGEGPWRTRPLARRLERVVLGPAVAPGTLAALLETPRSDLHQRWADIPESFYGISWLIVSRAVERIGLEGLHALCLRATREGRELVPLAWLEEAADLRVDQLDARFLAACFDRRSLQNALFLQPEAFAAVLLDSLLPLYGGLSFSGGLERARPSLRLTDASEVQVRSYGPVYRAMRQGWNTLPPAAHSGIAP